MSIPELISFIIEPYYGSNRVSRQARKIIEKIPLRLFVSVNLASLAFFGAIVVPTGEGLLSNFQTQQTTNVTIVDIVPTEAKLQWPLTRFGLSQGYSAVHPGIDMTTSPGTPIMPVARGTVEQVVSSPFGYGNHVIMRHDDGITSLYAHMSDIAVSQGESIDRDQSVGTVGTTGWSTGNHLHLEIYDQNVSVNPLEVLPDLK